MGAGELEPIGLKQRLKCLAIRGVHRLSSAYDYRGQGRGIDQQLEASVREREQALVVAPSLIPGAGQGLFADRDYEAGELICTYIGARLSWLQMLRTRNWAYMLYCGKDRHGRRVIIDARHAPRTKASYVNHHFDPGKRNVDYEEAPEEAKSLLLATRRIKKGEELYGDYGPKYWHIVEKPPALSLAGAKRRQTQSPVGGSLA